MNRSSAKIAYIVTIGETLVNVRESAERKLKLRLSRCVFDVCEMGVVVVRFIVFFLLLSDVIISLVLRSENISKV